MQNTPFQDLQSLIQKQIKVKTYNLSASVSAMDDSPLDQETYELKRKVICSKLWAYTVVTGIE